MIVTGPVAVRAPLKVTSPAEADTGAKSFTLVITPVELIVMLVPLVNCGDALATMTAPPGGGGGGVPPPTGTATAALVIWPMLRLLGPVSPAMTITPPSGPPLAPLVLMLQPEQVI